MTLKDLGYSGIAVVFAIALVMISYTALNDTIVNTMYDLAVTSGLDIGLANNIVLFWHYFPLAFLFSCFVWMIVSASREGGDSY